MQKTNNIGCILDESHISELLKKYDCTKYRIIPPDFLYTQEYDDNRLMICVDKFKEILDIKKG